jgi:hypothetical protein
MGVARAGGVRHLRLHGALADFDAIAIADTAVKPDGLHQLAIRCGRPPSVRGIDLCGKRLHSVGETAI